MRTLRAMSDNKCPFTGPLAAGFCNCPLAQEVVRRGGSEYDCMNIEAHTVCVALTAHLNYAALPELGYEDDLTLTPKSVYDKILIGGLQGLRTALDPANNEIETDNIWNIVKAYKEHYCAMDQIPTDVFLETIKGCKTKRRRLKK